MDEEEEQTIDPFSAPDDISDVILIVEEKKIYAHKSILGKSFILFIVLNRIEFFFSKNFSSI